MNDQAGLRSRPRCPLAALVFLLASPLGAAPADPDPGFGTDGFVTTTPGGRQVEIKGMAISPDGRIVVAGSMNSGSGHDFLISRFMPDGSLDPSFGSGGILVADFGSVYDSIEDVTLQPDGRIVAVGSTRIASSDFVAIARFMPDGSWDASFSGDGRQIASPGTIDHYASAVALQEDGRIVVAGSSGVPNGSDLTLMRFLPDGSRDPGFGNGGSLRVDFDGGRDGASALAIQDDLRIVVVGTSRPGDSRILGVACRFLPDGSPDPSFGILGKQVIPVSGAFDWLLTSEVIVDPQDRLLVSGTTRRGGNLRAVAFRLLPDGKPDRAFGVDGMAEADFTSVCEAMARAPDGKLVLVGSSRFAELGVSNTVAVIRMLADGRLDPGFSDDGGMTVGFGGAGIARSVRIQPDGRIVVAGIRAYGNRTLHLARFLGDPPLRIGFGTGPVLNRQTGLYEQRIEVENLTGGEIEGFDLSLSGLPPGISVNNASDRAGQDFVVSWRQAVPAGESVPVIVEYFAGRRGTGIEPVVTAEAVAGAGPHPPATDDGLAVERCLLRPDGSFLIEFRSTPGAWYEVHYSDDAASWKLSPVRIRAGGNRVQWIDRGPPRTEAPPAGGACRFYRVKKVAGP